MKASYKKIYFSLFTLLAIAWLTHFAYPVFFSLAVHKIKSDQRKIVCDNNEESEYVQYILPDSLFERIYDDEEQELSIGSERYEVIKFYKAGHEVHCTLLYDEEETFLDHNLVNKIQKHRPKRILTQVVTWLPLMTVFETNFRTLKYFIPAIEYAHKIKLGHISGGYYRKTLKPPICC